MPDTQTSKGTVDGIEPSILVRFVSNPNDSNATGVIRLFPNDEGAPRSLELDGEPVWITQKDLAAASGGYTLEIIENASAGTPAPAKDENPAPTVTPQNLPKTESFSPISTPVVGS